MKLSLKHPPKLPAGLEHGPRCPRCGNWTPSQRCFYCSCVYCGRSVRLGSWFNRGERLPRCDRCIGIAALCVALALAACGYVAAGLLLN